MSPAHKTPRGKRLSARVSYKLGASIGRRAADLGLTESDYIRFAIVEELKASRLNERIADVQAKKAKKLADFVKVDGEWVPRPRSAST